MFTLSPQYQGGISFISVGKGGDSNSLLPFWTSFWEPASKRIFSFRLLLRTGADNIKKAKCGFRFIIQIRFAGGHKVFLKPNCNCLLKSMTTEIHNIPSQDFKKRPNQIGKSEAWTIKLILLLKRFTQYPMRSIQSPI